MSLVFAAITPHPPVSIPGVGKENLKIMAKTKEGLEKLSARLAEAEPEVVIFISPHGEISPEAFTINLAENYQVDFEAFGDFATRLAVKGEMVLISSSREFLSKKFPVNVVSEPRLDHGIGVPVFYFQQKHQDFSVVPIYYSLLDSRLHLEFGKSLKEIILNSEKRIAIVASGDLSHCLKENAPLPFDPAGKEFDEKLIELLKQGDIQGVANLDPVLVEKAGECGWRSFLILLGALSNIKFKTEILSYEAPFGIGYLVADLSLEQSNK